MIMDRLVYGCARLTGGASAGASRRLLRDCLAAGIRHFDTAPSYGIGTAEEVVGDVLAGHPDARITAKVGSLRPSHAVARTYARALKGLLKRRASPLRDDFTPPEPNRRGGGYDFSRVAMERSLARSLHALRRERVDVLLLHEVYPADIDEKKLSFLADARTRGTAGAVGYSNGATADLTMTAAMPDGYVGQAAATPAMVTGANILHAPEFLHNIANTTLYSARNDAAFARWLDQAVARIPAAVADRRTAAIAAGYARLHGLLPNRGLIFASIDPDRLAAFLGAIRHIDAELGAAAFADQVRS